MVYVGSNGGPYKNGKLYCGYCGEFRRYGIDAAIAGNSNIIVCTFCGIKVRRRGRHYFRDTAKPEEQPKRY